MLDKLGAIEERFYYLEERLSDPSIVSDQKLFAKTNKDYSSLREVVEVYKVYKEVLGNIETAKEMLAEDDPDMKEMAKEELNELNPKKDELEEALKTLLIPKDPEDEKDVKVAKMFTMVLFLCESATYMVTTIFNLAKKSRKLMIFGMTLLSIVSIIASISKMIDNIWLLRATYPIFGIGYSAIFSGFWSYYISIVPPALSMMATTTFGLLGILLAAIVPLIFDKSKGNTSFMWGFIGMACISSTALILMIIFSKDLNGLDKKQIYNLLRDKNGGKKNIEKNGLKKGIEMRKEGYRVKSGDEENR